MLAFRRKAGLSTSGVEIPVREWPQGAAGWRAGNRVPLLHACTADVDDVAAMCGICEVRCDRIDESWPQTPND